MEHEKSSLKKNNLIRNSMLIICIFSGIITSGLIWLYYSCKANHIENAKKKAILINKQAVPKISAYLQQLTSTVEHLAHDLSSGTVTPDKIMERLNQKPSSIHGLGVAFAPYAYNKATRLYAPYSLSEGKNQKIIFIEKIVDYSKKGNERYPIITKPGFRDPFLDPVSKNIVIEYTAPFFDKKGEPIGIVFGNYSLENMQQLMASLYSGQYGHGSICTNTGLFISDAMSELVEQKKTVPQEAREYASVWLGDQLEKAIKGEINFIEEQPDWLFSGISWIIFEPIPFTPWYAYGVFAVDELVEDTTILNRTLIDAVLSVIFFFILLLCCIIGLYVQPLLRDWLISTVISLGIIISIIFLWNNTHQKIPFSRSTQIIEKSSFDVKKTIKTLSNVNTGQANLNPIVIPTGIYIHQLAVDIDKITINAYIWQQIPIDSPQKIYPGVIFPQAMEVTTKEIATFIDRGMKTIGWEVRCTLQQNFDYSNYPFDFKRIKIALWPSTFDNSTLLVPDLDGYAIISPSTLPGLSAQINEEQNWHYHLSYFVYQKSNLQVSFGYNATHQQIEENQKNAFLPELNFDILASHYVIGALILNLTPILIILVLLFILLSMAPLMEFSSIFGILSSLFFTGLIAYTGFKTYLPIQQVVFFDYLYFLLQTTTLIIAILVVAYYSKFNIPIVKYKHMLIPQLLFWPWVSGTILIISLIFFY